MEKDQKPFYFYHLVDKNSDMSNGIISLQYMYDNNLFNLFDKNVVKYKNRITYSWNIKKYKNKKSLTREEYIDALNIFRGKYGSNYIYFFRYPPYRALGKKIEELSKHKDIYRIDLNNQKVKKIINDIFYGYNMSNSDNKLLSRAYYEKVSKQEYFSNYNDNLLMNFKPLNHISISFKNGYCPLELLEKVEWE